jgi:hypothetical protein
MPVQFGTTTTWSLRGRGMPVHRDGAAVVMSMTIPTVATDVKAATGASLPMRGICNVRKERLLQVSAIARTCFHGRYGTGAVGRSRVI